MDLEGLITPTSLHYTVQHFAVPPVVETDKWELNIVGEVKSPLTLNFDQLRRFAPSHSSVPSPARLPTRRGPPYPTPP